MSIKPDPYNWRDLKDPFSRTAIDEFTKKHRRLGHTQEEVDEVIDDAFEEYLRFDDLAKELEVQWKSSLMLKGDSRIKEIEWWSENRSLIYRNLDRWRQELAMLDAEKEVFMRTGGHSGTPFRERDQAYPSIEKQKYGFKREQLEHKLTKLVKMLSTIKAYEKREDEEGFDLELLKQIPIDSVLVHYGRVPNRGGYIQSPFHEEKTPSCKIYTNTNSFYDYSQGKGGSVIDLVMALEGCSMKQALMVLKQMQ